MLMYLKDHGSLAGLAEALAAEESEGRQVSIHYSPGLGLDDTLYTLLALSGQLPHKSGHSLDGEGVRWSKLAGMWRRLAYMHQEHVAVCGHQAGNGNDIDLGPGLDAPQTRAQQTRALHPGR